MIDEPFFINVHYKGVEREFQTILRLYGYTQRFHVDVEGTDVQFERDEEGAWRAIIPPDTKGKIPDTGLLQIIAETIEKILS